MQNFGGQRVLFNNFDAQLGELKFFSKKLQLHVGKNSLCPYIVYCPKGQQARNQTKPRGKQTMTTIRPQIWDFVRNKNVKENAFATRREITEFYCALKGKPYRRDALKFPLGCDGMWFFQGKKWLTKVNKNQYVAVEVSRLGDEPCLKFQIGEMKGVFLDF